MATAIPYRSIGSLSAKSSCLCVPKEKPTCFRFSVDTRCVCVVLWGLEGRTFGLERLRLDDACKVIGSVAYPPECPYVFDHDGEELIIAKPGTYEICSCDDEPLPHSFEVEKRYLSDCQATLGVKVA